MGSSKLPGLLNADGLDKKKMIIKPYQNYIFYHIKYLFKNSKAKNSFSLPKIYEMVE